MSEEVDNFLAHVGKKGMKWGVRKKVQTLGKNVSTGYKNLDPKTQLALKVGASTAVLAGTAAASAIIARRGMVSAAKVNESVNFALHVVNNAAKSASYTPDQLQLMSNWREVDAGIKWAREILSF